MQRTTRPLAGCFSFRASKAASVGGQFHFPLRTQETAPTGRGLTVAQESQLLHDASEGCFFMRRLHPALKHDQSSARIRGKVWLRFLVGMKSKQGLTIFRVSGRPRDENGPNHNHFGTTFLKCSELRDGDMSPSNVMCGATLLEAVGATSTHSGLARS